MCVYAGGHVMHVCVCEGSRAHRCVRGGHVYAGDHVVFARGHVRVRGASRGACRGSRVCVYAGVTWCVQGITWCACVYARSHVVLAGGHVVCVHTGGSRGACVCVCKGSRARMCVRGGSRGVCRGSCGACVYTQEVTWCMQSITWCTCVYARSHVVLAGGHVVLAGGHMVLVCTHGGSRGECVCVCEG